MSEMSEKARAALKSKAERMTRADPHARVDASGYSPDGQLDGNVQTGPRPISRRQFRRGGTVAGAADAPRADRKPRATGGRAALTADSYQNRDMKDANEEREGTKHVGGMKRGGKLTAEARNHIKTKNFAGPDRSYPIEDESHARNALARVSQHGSPELQKEVRAKVHAKYPGIGKKTGGSVRGPAVNDGTRPTGGRLARKGGGRTKKGTNVNIIIAPQGSGAVPPPRPMPVPTAAPPGVPVGLHQGAPPVMPPAAPGAGMPMRARGGGVYPIDAGAGSGLGRLEKAKRASRS